MSNSMRAGEKAPGGICPWCYGVYALRDDGHVRQHRLGKGGSICEGSSQLPLPPEDWSNS